MGNYTCLASHRALQLASFGLHYEKKDDLNSLISHKSAQDYKDLRNYLEFEGKKFGFGMDRGG